MTKSTLENQSLEHQFTYNDIVSCLMESYGGAKACDASSNDNDFERHVASVSFALVL